MPRPASQWPVYFAKRSVKGRLVSMKPGDVFLSQDMQYIRALGPSFGVPDSRTQDFSALDYVQVLDVGTRVNAAAILGQRMTLKKAQAFLEASDG